VSQDEETVSKVEFGNVDDFKFIAAYGKYSEMFDNVSEENKSALNEIVTRLYNKEIEYSSFYYELNKLSETPETLRRFRRTSIKGQRKRDYHRDQQKRRSITRHKR
jgi:hypothetical protein